jgi:hypothetical protein
MDTRLAAIMGVLVLGGVASADRAAEEKLAASLRDLLVAHLPKPLHEDSKHWGRQAKNLRGKMVNDGRWYKTRIEAGELPASAQVDVRDMKAAGPDRQTFTLKLDLAAVGELERQTWLRGVRLYSGSTRARVRLHLTMDCEITSRLESPMGKLVPEMVFQFRVVRSDFSYDGLVVEHTAGVGGDAAKTIGEVMIAMVKTAKPGLERKMIDKANAAVLKAGDSKEVRVSLLEGLKRKKK